MASRRRRAGAPVASGSNKENSTLPNQETGVYNGKEMHTDDASDFISAGSAIELKKRLKKFAGNLSELEQDAIGTSSKKDKKKLAVHAQNLLELMDHKDKTIRILCACSIADILRLYVPEPPYNDSDLERVFSFLVKQLAGISNTAGKDFSRYFYLLQSVAEVKFFLLCPTLEDGPDIATALLNVLFESIGHDHAHQVVSYMVDIVASIVHEWGDDLPPRLVEIILCWLMKDKSDGEHHQQAPRACQVAQAVVTKAAEVLKKPLAELVESVVVGGDPDESPLAASVFPLIEKVAKLCPEVLDNVYPLLLQQLRIEDDAERIQIATVVCKIMADNHAHILADQPHLWQGLLARFRDADAKIRAVLAEHAKYFLVYHHEHCAADLTSYLKDALTDVDEEVRAKAVVSVVDACSQQPAVVSTDLLGEVKDRCRDKRTSVRRVAVEKLAGLYTKVVHRIGTSEWDAAAVAKFGWIPEKIVRLWYLVGRTDPNTKLVIEKLVEYVLIAPSKANKKKGGEHDAAVERARRLLFIFNHFSESTRTIFTQMIIDQGKLRAHVSEYLKIRLQSKPTSDQLSLKDLSLAKMAQGLPDPTKSLTALQALDGKKDRGVFQHLQQLFKTPNLTVADLQKELTRILGKKERNILAAVSNLFYRAAPSHSTEPIFLALVEEVLERGQQVFEFDDQVFNEEAVRDRDNKLERGGELLGLVLQSFGDIATTDVVEEVVKLIDAPHGIIVETGFKLVVLLKSTLPPTVFRRLEAKCMTALDGSDAKVAKRAARALIGMKSDKLKDVAEQAVDQIDSRTIVGLSVLKEIAFVPEARDHVEELLPYLKQLFKAQVEVRDVEGANDWAPDVLTAQARVIIKAIKVYGVVASALDDAETSKEMMEFLFEVIDLDGALSEEEPQEGLPEAFRGPFRLACFKTIIKVAGKESLSVLLTPQRMQLLGLIIQDSLFEIREAAVQTLGKAFKNGALPIHFLVLFVLSAIDPETDNVDRAANALKSISGKARSQRQAGGFYPEYVYPHLVHLLAGHDDFQTIDKATAEHFMHYLSFFFDNYVQPSGYDLLFQLASALKNTETLVAGRSKKVYCLCDLTIDYLQKRLKKITVSGSSIPIKLPLNLFRIIRGKRNAVSYLPEGYHDSNKKEKKERTPKKKVVAAKSKPAKMMEDPSPPARRQPSRATKKLDTTYNNDDDNDEAEENFFAPRKRSRV